MKLLTKHFLTIRDGHRPPLQLAGNDAEGAMLANAAEGGSPFAILQADGFLVPFGEFPHKQGLQKFDRAAAEAIVANHHGIFNKIKTWALGEKPTYPVYVGHPDLPGSKDTDKRAYGWIENMAVRGDGLHLGVKWSPAGLEMVENAHFKFYSPLWWTKPLKGGGIQPVALKSMGLTNDPNIPVPALANESEMLEAGGQMPEARDQKPEEEESQNDEPTENKEPMKPEILAALGLEEGATPEEVLAKITETQTAANTAVTDLSAMETELATANGRITELETAGVAAQEAMTAANEKATALEASLVIAANAAVQAAVAAGRVTPAEAEAKATEILAANDFAAALQELGKLPAKVKTESATGDLGSAKSRLVLASNDASAAARMERAQLVENEFAATNPERSLGERKRTAWRRAQAKRPDLFGGKGGEDSSGTAA